MAIARRRTLVPLAGSLPPPFAHHIPLSKREVGSRWKRGEKRKIEEPLFLPIFHRRPSLLLSFHFARPLVFVSPWFFSAPLLPLFRTENPFEICTSSRSHSLSISRPCCSCSLFYLRRSRQIRERKALFFLLLLLGGGPFSNVPCTFF